MSALLLPPLLTEGIAGAQSGSDDDSAEEAGVSTGQGIAQGVLERIQSASQPEEAADAVLIRSKEWKWNRYLKAAGHLPDWIDLGLENRTRFEVFDHPFRSGEFGTDAQVPQRSRVRFGLNGGPVRFLFEGQDSRTNLFDPGEFSSTANENEFDILQLFVSLTARDVLGSGLRTDLHVGRLTMDFGKRRYIARNDFRNTTNAFDGVHWQIGRKNTWRFRAFLVEPLLRDDVQLDEQSKRSVFWGTYFENHEIPWLKYNLYYFGLNDQRSQTISAQRTFNTYGVRVFKEPGMEQVDYEIEVALQTGHRGNTDHFAYNPHVELGYTLDAPWSPRFVVQYDYASGTRTPGSSQDGTFDRLFGARRFDLMPTGIFGPFQRSNLSSPGWRVIVEPGERWRVQLKHRVWYLAQGRDAFVGTGLQDPTGGSGNFLGHDVELRVQWKLNDNLEFDAGYDHWFKGSYFDRLPDSAGLPDGGEQDTDYFYILTKLRF